jgi:hypothetical protein
MLCNGGGRLRKPLHSTFSFMRVIFFLENKKEVLYGSTECRIEVMSNK